VLEGGAVGKLRRGRRTDAPLRHKEGRRKRDGTGGGKRPGDDAQLKFPVKRIIIGKILNYEKIVD
jgi:hypothetical protein